MDDSDVAPDAHEPGDNALPSELLEHVHDEYRHGPIVPDEVDLKPSELPHPQRGDSQ